MAGIRRALVLMTIDRYITMAIKEANELESHLQRVVDSGLCPQSEHARLTAATVEVRKMLIGFRKRLQ